MGDDGECCGTDQVYTQKLTNTMDTTVFTVPLNTCDLGQTSCRCNFEVAVCSFGFTAVNIMNMLVFLYVICCYGEKNGELPWISYISRFP